MYEEGSEWVLPGVFAQRLTSRQLKVKPKANNIAGLQVADILAHCSYKGALARRMRQELATNFGGQICQVLEDLKYNKSPSGKIEGWGRKWLP